MIDRSAFLDELRQNPALMRRLGVIVNGEVGNGTLEDKILNLETVFNRATAQGKTLDQVTQPRSNGGYYPQTTFDHGERILSRGNNEGAFNEQVLKPVLAGSDVSTSKLGFPATGNASDAPGNPTASNGIRDRYYTNYKWVDSPGGRELYVQHQPDNIARLEAKRTDQPPSATPATASAAPAAGPVAWPRVVPYQDQPAPPRPPGEVPQMQVPGANVVQAYQPGQSFGRTATAHAEPFKAIVSHYTGSDNLQSALSTARGDPARGGVPYGYTFIIDKDGTIYQAAPLDARTNHVQPPTSSERTARPDISNSNAMGIAFVGSSEKDLTPQQLQAGGKLYPAAQQRFAIPTDNVVGHGEIQSSREPSEGMTLVNAVRNPSSAPATASSYAPTMANAPGQQAISRAISYDPATGEPTTPAAPTPPVVAPGLLPPGFQTGTSSSYYPPSQYPGYRLPVQQSVANPEPGGPTSVPMPWRRPGAAGPNAAGQTGPVVRVDAAGRIIAPQTAPGATAAAPAAQVPGAAGAAPGGAPGSPSAPARPQTMGHAIAQALTAGPGAQAPPGASTYIDPRSGHLMLNPSGGGEQGMGIVRDLGLPAQPAARSPPVRPAPAPSRPAAAASPPGATGSSNVPPAREPVPPTPPPGATPHEPLIFDSTPTSQRGTLSGGLPTASDLTGGLSMPASTYSQPRGPVPVAPEIAGLLAKPSPSPGPIPGPQPTPPPFSSAAAQSTIDRMLTPPEVFPASPAQPPPLQKQASNYQLPMTQPVTVKQQLGGLSPFAPNMQPPQDWPVPQQQQDQLLSQFAIDPQQSAFPSTGLLPFQQYPMFSFDSGGWNSPASFDFGAFA